MAKSKYECKICGNTKDADGKEIPVCCGKPMKQMKLDVCTNATSAEHARPFNDDEPCDEGTSGKRV